MSATKKDQLEDLKNMRHRAEADGEDTTRLDEIIAKLEKEHTRERSER